MFREGLQKIVDNVEGGLAGVLMGFDGIAVETYGRLRSELSDLAVGLLHGRLSPAEKAAVMQRFVAGEVQLLVCTTVIEVGVDVPNASLMVIESAERADAIAHLSVPFHNPPRAVPRLVTGVATTSAGTACAFVTFTPIYGGVTPETTTPGNQSSGQGWGWSLDLMRRVPDAPPGVMELLLVRALERFQSCGAHVVSFGLVALADTSQEMTPVERKLVSLATDGLHLMEHRETLFNFKQKFQPSWQSRYLVTNTTLALPKIALAVLRLRNYSGGGVAVLRLRNYSGGGVARLLRGSDKPRGMTRCAT